MRKRLRSGKSKWHPHSKRKWGKSENFPGLSLEQKMKYPEGKGTHRSRGSNVRAKYILEKRGRRRSKR